MIQLYMHEVEGPVGYDKGFKGCSNIFLGLSSSAGLIQKGNVMLHAWPHLSVAKQVLGAMDAQIGQPVKMIKGQPVNPSEGIRGRGS